jgi:hypothetical protein
MTEEIATKQPTTVKESLDALGVSPAIQILGILQKGNLNDRDKIKAWETLLRYCEPQLASTQVKISADVNTSARRKSTSQIEQETLWSDDYLDED